MAKSVVSTVLFHLQQGLYSTWTSYHLRQEAILFIIYLKKKLHLFHSDPSPKQRFYQWSLYSIHAISVFLVAESSTISLLSCQQSSFTSTMVNQVAKPATISDYVAFTEVLVGWERDLRSLTNPPELLGSQRPWSAFTMPPESSESLERDHPARIIVLDTCIWGYLRRRIRGN